MNESTATRAQPRYYAIRGVSDWAIKPHARNVILAVTSSMENADLIVAALNAQTTKGKNDEPGERDRAASEAPLMDKLTAGMKHILKHAVPEGQNPPRCDTEQGDLYHKPEEKIPPGHQGQNPQAVLFVDDGPPRTRFEPGEWMRTNKGKIYCEVSNAGPYKEPRQPLRRIDGPASRFPATNSEVVNLIEVHRLMVAPCGDSSFSARNERRLDSPEIAKSVDAAVRGYCQRVYGLAALAPAAAPVTTSDDDPRMGLSPTDAACPSPSHAPAPDRGEGRAAAAP